MEELKTTKLLVSRLLFEASSRLNTLLQKYKSLVRSNDDSLDEVTSFNSVLYKKNASLALDRRAYSGRNVAVRSLGIHANRSIVYHDVFNATDVLSVRRASSQSLAEQRMSTDEYRVFGDDTERIFRSYARSRGVVIHGE